MKGDFTRFTFKPEQHYNGVRMQQGRVQLDTDFNEYVDIQAHLNQTVAKDVIGLCGAPQADAGFEIGVSDDGTDLTISPGRFYVDGILCEVENLSVPILSFPEANEVEVDALTLDGRHLEPGQWVEVLIPDAASQLVRINSIDIETRIVTLEDAVTTSADPESRLRLVVTYSSQPDYPNPVPALEGEAPIAAGTYLAYLDVWHRLITVLEDASVREVALGGPDTTTRTKTIDQGHPAA